MFVQATGEHSVEAETRPLLQRGDVCWEVAREAV